MEIFKKITKDSNLTAEHFFILYLLFTDPTYYVEYITKKKYKINIGAIIQDLSIFKYIVLKDKDYTNPLNIQLDPESFKIFEDSDVTYPYLLSSLNFDEEWNEFLELYPKKSGDRPLHNMKEKCRAKYAFALKKETHENIMKGLKKEIELRQIAKAKNKFFPEWKLLSTYINQKGWEQFLEIGDENEVEMEADGRITKIL
jgi:hypothetical protein